MIELATPQEHAARGTHFCQFCEVEFWRSGECDWCPGSQLIEVSTASNCNREEAWYVAGAMPEANASPADGNTIQERFDPSASSEGRTVETNTENTHEVE